jgi:hypothetical protein
VLKNLIFIIDKNKLLLYNLYITRDEEEIIMKTLEQVTKWILELSTKTSSVELYFDKKEQTLLSNQEYFIDSELQVALEKEPVTREEVRNLALVLDFGITYPEKDKMKIYF